MRGLIAPLQRKNGWTLAEEAGHAGPDRIHRMLNRVEWGADEVLYDVRQYVVDHLDDLDAVLVVDDTGFLKKGARSAGVQRQYSGTVGRTENCRIGVFLAYATGRGRTLIDRRLYLPTSWTDDRDRCHRAGIDDEVVFETKVAMAKGDGPPCDRGQGPTPVEHIGTGRPGADDVNTKPHQSLQTPRTQPLTWLLVTASTVAVPGRQGPGPSIARPGFQVASSAWTRVVRAGRRPSRTTTWRR
ncbi:hypothetical protein GCM10010206_66240 [Streptomyces cinerochromogenes]|nr:hypothetical protein GCM10010206_66240 [Streptomyces cinerochromogenes]